MGCRRFNERFQYEKMNWRINFQIFGGNFQTIVNAPTIERAKRELRKNLVIMSVEPNENINIELNDIQNSEPTAESELTADLCTEAVN